MELVPLTVEAREETGKGPARRMRAAGAIPGVVYGMGREAVLVAVPQRVFERMYVGSEEANTLIDLTVPGTERESSIAAIIKEVQRDPVTRALLSVDFQWVSLRQELQVDVPIEFTGRAPGVADEGGMVQQHLHTIAVTCLPTDIPERIVASVEGMQIGDSLHVSALPQIPGVTYVPEPDEVVLTISPPISEAELETRAEEGIEALVDLEVAEEGAAQTLAPEESAEESGEESSE